MQSGTPESDELLMLIALPPYFRQGMESVLADDEEDVLLRVSGRDARHRFEEEFPQYRDAINEYISPIDVPGFRRFTQEHRHYFGERIGELEERSDGDCYTLLEVLAHQRTISAAQQQQPWVETKLPQA